MTCVLEDDDQNFGITAVADLMDYDNKRHRATEKQRDEKPMYHTLDIDKSMKFDMLYKISM